MLFAEWGDEVGDVTGEDSCWSEGEEDKVRAVKSDSTPVPHSAAGVGPVIGGYSSSSAGRPSAITECGCSSSQNGQRPGCWDAIWGYQPNVFTGLGAW